MISRFLPQCIERGVSVVPDTKGHYFNCHDSSTNNDRCSCFAKEFVLTCFKLHTNGADEMCGEQPDLKELSDLGAEGNSPIREDY